MSTLIRTLGLVVVLVGCVPSPGVLDRSLEQHYPLTVEPPKPVTGSIYDSGARTELFEDVKAKTVGDILVVQLVEQTDAQKNSSTSITKGSSVDVDNPVLGGETREIGRGSNLGFDLNSNHEFSGTSGSDQSNRLSGTVAVTVTRILPGGNLLIEGEKWISINRGREYIRLRGMVRPKDITLNNVVASTRIANAEISYSGTGETANANTPGWLSRFFMGRMWPF